MKALFQLSMALLFILNTLLEVTGQTFSKTYVDTLSLSCLSENSLEYNGYYYTSSSGGGVNLQQGFYCQITKIATNGDLEKRFFAFDTTRSYSSGPPLFKDSNGNFIISLGESVKGWISPRGIIAVKLTEDFDTIWHFRHSDTTQFDSPHNIYRSENGYIYISGGRNYYKDEDPYSLDGFLLILTDNGDLVDFKTFDEGGREYFTSLTPCEDGGCFLGGATNSFTGQNEGYLVKVDSLGNKLWAKHYSQFANCSASLYSIEKLILSGYKLSSIGTGVLGLADTSGALIWTRNYSYSGNPAFYNAICTSRKDIIAVGIATLSGEGDSGFIMSVDSMGEPNWSRRYNYNEFTDFFSNLIETSDGGFLINGSASDIDGSGQNLWLVKLDSMGCLEPNCWEVGIEDAKANELGVKVFPNPASEWLNFKLPGNSGEITLEVFSISGQRVLHTTLFAPLEAIQVGHLPLGLYLAKLTNSDGTNSTQRIVIAR
ncbi:MAG: T9SS type A sorting domain-containing protein [Bacteroidia bacterium]|nr:T9SS type A sorting domain-containing protein [Bacteroidia bacterium]